MRLRALFALALLAGTALVAHADTFTFDFLDVDSNNTVFSFYFQNPTLITTDTTLTPIRCEFAGFVCDKLVFSTMSFETDVYSQGRPVGTVSGVRFDRVGYVSLYGGYLNITQIMSTPEPSSIALLGTGLLGVVGVVKRRFA